MWEVMEMLNVGEPLMIEAKRRGIIQLLAALSAANLSVALDSISIYNRIATMRSKGTTAGSLETYGGLHTGVGPGFEKDTWT